MERSPARHSMSQCPSPTQRLSFTRVRTQDVAFLTALRTDPSVRQYLGGPLTSESARTKAEAAVGADDHFVVNRHDGQPVGACSVTPHPPYGVEVSYEFL